MRYVITLALLSTTFFHSYTQSTTLTTTASSPPTVTNSPKLAEEGTFLLIPVSKQKEVFTTERMLEIRKFVEEKRDMHQERILNISPLTNVIIPSTATIQSATFKKYKSYFEE